MRLRVSYKDNRASYSLRGIEFLTVAIVVDDIASALNSLYLTEHFISELSATFLFE